MSIGCGIKERTTNSRDTETKNKPVLIANFVDRIAFARGDEKVDKGNDKVSSKEGELNEVGLQLVEIKIGFEFWNEQVIHAANEAPHKEEGRDGCEGESVVG